MNTMRRRANLEKKVQAIEEEIARQEKARQGVESLFKVYQEQLLFRLNRSTKSENVSIDTEVLFVRFLGHQMDHCQSLPHKTIRDFVEGLGELLHQS